jgi:hypothetical protein
MFKIDNATNRNEAKFNSSNFHLTINSQETERTLSIGTFTQIIDYIAQNLDQFMFQKYMGKRIEWDERNVVKDSCTVKYGIESGDIYSKIHVHMAINSRLLEGYVAQVDVAKIRDYFHDILGHEVYVYAKFLKETNLMPVVERYVGKGSK